MQAGRLFWLVYVIVVTVTGLLGLAAIAFGDIGLQEGRRRDRVGGHPGRGDLLRRTAPARPRRAGGVDTCRERPARDSASRAAFIGSLLCFVIAGGLAIEEIWGSFGESGGDTRAGLAAFVLGVTGFLLAPALRRLREHAGALG